MLVAILDAWPEAWTERDHPPRVCTCSRDRTTCVSPSGKPKNPRLFDARGSYAISFRHIQKSLKHEMKIITVTLTINDEKIAVKMKIVAMMIAIEVFNHVIVMIFIE